MKYPDATAISGKLIPFEDKPQRVSNPSDEELDFDVADKSQLAAHQKPAYLEWWGCMMTMSRHIFTEFGDLPAICNVLDATKGERLHIPLNMSHFKLANGALAPKIYKAMRRTMICEANLPAVVAK